jgi:hypothetical protein
LSVCILSSCGTFHDLGVSDTTNQQTQEPEELLSPSATLTLRLETLRNPDIRQWSGLIEESYLASALAIVDEKLGDFECEITKETTEASYASVTLTITTFSFGSAYTRAFEEVLSDVAQKTSAAYLQENGESATEALTDQEKSELADVLVAISYETLTSTEATELFSEAFREAFVSANKDYRVSVSVELVRDASGRWVVSETSSHDEVIDALYGGLISAARSLSERSADEGYLRGYVLEAG